MASDVLGVVASSVPAERANSDGKKIFDDRECLHNDTFKAEVCVKSWIKLLKANAISIPTDYNKAYNELDAGMVKAGTLECSYHEHYHTKYPPPPLPPLGPTGTDVETGAKKTLTD